MAYCTIILYVGRAVVTVLAGFWICNNKRNSLSNIKPLKPNDTYRGRTAPLTSKRCILYIYSTNIGTEYFKHGIYFQFFSSSKCRLFHNSNVFGSRVIHILYTVCAKIKKKNNSGAKRLRQPFPCYHILNIILNAVGVWFNPLSFVTQDCQCLAWHMHRRSWLLVGFRCVGVSSSCITYQCEHSSRSRWHAALSSSPPVTICTARFNPQQFYVLPHTAVFMCFVWIWDQTAIISLYSIDWLVFITETESVYCAVRTGYLNRIHFSFTL